MVRTRSRTVASSNSAGSNWEPVPDDSEDMEAEESSEEEFERVPTETVRTKSGGRGKNKTFKTDARGIRLTSGGHIYRDQSGRKKMPLDELLRRGTDKNNPPNLDRCRRFLRHTIGDMREAHENRNIALPTYQDKIGYAESLTRWVHENNEPSNAAQDQNGPFVYPRESNSLGSKLRKAPKRSAPAGLSQSGRSPCKKLKISTSSRKPSDSSELHWDDSPGIGRDWPDRFPIAPISGNLAKHSMYNWTRSFPPATKDLAEWHSKVHCRGFREPFGSVELEDQQRYYGKAGWQRQSLEDEMTERLLDPEGPGQWSWPERVYPRPCYQLGPNETQESVHENRNRTLTLLRYEIEGAVRRYGANVLEPLQTVIQDIRADHHEDDGGLEGNTTKAGFLPPPRFAKSSLHSSNTDSSSTECPTSPAQLKRKVRSRKSSLGTSSGTYGGKRPADFDSDKAHYSQKRPRAAAPPVLTWLPHSPNGNNSPVLYASPTSIDMPMALGSGAHGVVAQGVAPTAVMTPYPLYQLQPEHMAATYSWPRSYPTTTRAPNTRSRDDPLAAANNTTVNAASAGTPAINPSTGGGGAYPAQLVRRPVSSAHTFSPVVGSAALAAEAAGEEQDAEGEPDTEPFYDAANPI